MDKLKCIPFVAHEAAMERKDRTIKRLIGVILATCVICNGAWIYAWMQKG